MDKPRPGTIRMWDPDAVPRLPNMERFKQYLASYEPDHAAPYLRIDSALLRTAPDPQAWHYQSSPAIRSVESPGRFVEWRLTVNTYWAPPPIMPEYMKPDKHGKQRPRHVDWTLYFPISTFSLWGSLDTNRHIRALMARLSIKPRPCTALGFPIEEPPFPKRQVPVLETVNSLYSKGT